MKISDKQMHDLYRSGAAWDELEEQTGMHHEALRYRLRVDGVTRAPVHLRISERARQQVVQMYVAGDYLSDIEAATGAKGGSITRILDDAGIPRNRRSKELP